MGSHNTIFKYEDSPIFFEDDGADVRVFTWKHGTLGFIYEEDDVFRASVKPVDEPLDISDKNAFPSMTKAMFFLCDEANKK